MPQSVEPRVFAIIPAAGSGLRMGLSFSKALLNIAGKTVIQRSVETVLSCSSVFKAVILARSKDLDEFAKLPLDWEKVALVPGGETRQQSVLNGIYYLTESYPQLIGGSYILVHDAARCLISKELVGQAIEGAFKWGAITTAIPVIDTIKQTSPEGVVEATLPREKLVAVQTPQVFKFELLQKAHQQALNSPQEAATDDASLVEKIHPVQVVTGERTNLKITTPEDARYAEHQLFQKGQ